MEDSVLQRVKVIMDAKSKNESDFARKTGICQRTINNYVKLNREPSLSAVRLILESFPDISPDWLILGKGSMYRTSATAEITINGPQTVTGSNNMTNSPHSQQSIQGDPNMMLFLMNQVTELQEQNKKLSNLLSPYMKK